MKLPGIICLAILSVVSGNAHAKLTCNLSGGAAAFGAYDPVTAAEVLTTGSIKVTCNGPFNAVLSLGVGNGAGASYSGGRRMTGSAGGTLIYNLYADAALSRVLGNGTGGSVTLNVSGPNSRTQAIWGRIPGGQNSVRAGSYGDTVVATISY